MCAGETRPRLVERLFLQNSRGSKQGQELHLIFLRAKGGLREVITDTRVDPGNTGALGPL